MFFFKKMQEQRDTEEILCNVYEELEISQKKNKQLLVENAYLKEKCTKLRSKREIDRLMIAELRRVLRSVEDKYKPPPGFNACIEYLSTLNKI